MSFSNVGVEEKLGGIVEDGVDEVVMVEVMVAAWVREMRLRRATRDGWSRMLSGGGIYSAIP